MPSGNSSPPALAEDWRHGGFGIYVHWPFCQAKCPYCDFNSHVAARIDQRRWLNAYLEEIRRHAELVPDRVLTSIFFGGGTPSLMEPETVAGVIEGIRRHWPAANDLEITLEANPTSVEAGRFQGYRAAGVSRVSMGIQALNDPDLRRLGRLHSADEALAAFDIARRVFPSVSFDLIYARQDQTAGDWGAELSRALELGLDHLSLYQLTVEDGTAFGDRLARGGLRGLPDEDRAADLYALTQDLCGTAGLPAYEVSNHARPGAESVHNRVYWRYGDYAGIGPGAHGRLTMGGIRHATEAIRAPGQWLAAVETGQRADATQALSHEEAATEMLLMGLRLAEGIDVKRYASLSGKPLNPQVLDRLGDMGMVVLTGGRLSVTPAGRPVLNAILRELLP